MVPAAQDVTLSTTIATMEVKGQLPRPVLGPTLVKSRYSNGTVVFYLAGILFSWLICTQILDIRVQIRRWHPESGDSGISLSQNRTCKPFLPSNLLQMDPPSSSDPSFLLPIRQFELQVSMRAGVTATDSITVGIVSSKALIWSNGFGRARANGTEMIPPNEHTIYRIASISKLFATMEAFILRDRGIINWDDPVQKHIPNFTYNRQSWKDHLKQNEVSEAESDPITLRQLASHMAGIGKLPPYNFDWWPYPPPKLPPVHWPTLEEQLESIAKLPLTTPPYAFPVYSNAGFSLLGASLTSAYSHATGNETTYAELLKRDIFTPLGMNGSSFVVSDQNRDHLAIPRQGDEIDFVGPDSFDPTGGQFSSLHDLSKAVRSLLTSNHRDSVLSSTSRREWLRPMHSFPDSFTETGLAWEILKVPDSHRRDQRYYSKRGDLLYSHSEFMINPDLQYGIVVLLTGTSADTAYISELAVRTFQPVFEKILEKRARDRYVGVWHGRGQDRIDVALKDGSLWITKWKANGVDFLDLYQGSFASGLTLWSTGRLDEFRVAIGARTVNWGCMPYWLNLDLLHSHHAPIDLIYFDEDDDGPVLQFPSANVTLHRWL